MMRERLQSAAGQLEKGPEKFKLPDLAGQLEAAVYDGATGVIHLFLCSNHADDAEWQVGETLTLTLTR